MRRTKMLRVISLLIFVVVFSCADTDQLNTTISLFPIVDENNKWGAIDVTGEVRLKPEYNNDKFIYTFIENGGLCYTQDSSFILIKIDNEGYLEIDTVKSLKGIPIVEMNRDIFRSDGGWRLFVKSYSYNFVNHSEELLCKDDFPYARNFSKNIAVAGDVGSYGYINVTGDYFNDKRYDRASSFYEELAIVSIGGEISYIDKEFKKVYSFIKLDTLDKSILEDYPRNCFRDEIAKERCRNSEFESNRNHLKYISRVFNIFDFLNGDL